MFRHLVIVLSLLPAVSFGWGFTAHRRLAAMMHEPLPPNLCLRKWYADRQTAALQDTACDPDRWRYMDSPQFDPDEWPRHYLEADRIDPASAYPREWADAVATFKQYAAKNGQVPWRVEEMYGLLVEAFRAKNTAEILRLSFLFSHYVTDSFSLLHNTLNYDPNGLHSRWESDMFSNSSNLNNMSTLARTYYGTPGRLDPRYAIFDTVIVGSGQAPALIAQDAPNPSMSAFFNAVKDMTARRWGDSLTVLSSLLWSAWADAGAPDLTGFDANCMRTLPPGTATLVGFPPPGGFTSRDGGFHPPDASVVDAGYDDAGEPNETEDGGTGGGTAGVGGGGEMTGGGGEEPAPTCGCSDAGGLGLVSLGVLAMLRRRSRR